MKNALLVVNPSSGGERALEFRDLAQAKLEEYFDQVLIKETQKAEMLANLPRRLRKKVLTVSLSWAEMGQLTRALVVWLRKNIDQILDFPTGYSQ